MRRASAAPLFFLVHLLLMEPALAGIEISDSTTGADVTAGKLHVTLNPDGGLSPVALVDQYARTALIPEPITAALATCSYSVHFNNQNEGAALDARNYTSATTTMTITQASNYITLNAAAVTTINTNARVTTHRVMPYMDGQPLVAVWTFRRPTGQTGQTNETLEMGLVTHTGATAPTDGLLFRWNASGEFRAVSVFNSTESTTLLTSPSANVTHVAAIFRRVTGTDFYIDGVRVAVIDDAAQANPISTRGVPFSARVYNGGVAPATAPQLLIGPVTILRCGDADKGWGDKLASAGLYNNQAPLTPYAQTANHANSTSPTSATLSNTAAGYTTLGGRYQFAAPLGAATDFALFGYQVPAGYQLYVTGIAISACNTGAAVATTATMLDWSIAVDSTAVSLATADSFGPPFVSMGPRRTALGMQGFIVGAGIGVCAPDIVRSFNPPLVAEPSRFAHVIVQVPVGTATASQVIRGDVTITGYFE
jgi:hypothetical protein